MSPTVLAPPIQPRVPPAECLVAVDEPIEEHAPPPAARASCEAEPRPSSAPPQTLEELKAERKAWALCMSEKARAIAADKERDRLDKEIERTRRKACADFIRQED